MKNRSYTDDFCFREICAVLAIDCLRHRLGPGIWGRREVADRKHKRGTKLAGRGYLVVIDAFPVGEESGEDSERAED